MSLLIGVKPDFGRIKTNATFVKALVAEVFCQPIERNEFVGIFANGLNMLVAGLPNGCRMFTGGQ